MPKPTNILRYNTELKNAILPKCHLVLIYEEKKKRVKKKTSKLTTKNTVYI